MLRHFLMIAAGAAIAATRSVVVGAPGTTGHLVGCATLSHSSTASLAAHSSSGSFSFGTARFALEFDSTTLALRNITTCTGTAAAGGRSQGFLWPAGPFDVANGFSLWQLNYTDCRSAIPNGVTLDALGSSAVNRSHSVAPLPAGGGSVLSLRWHGVAVGPGEPSIDVVITVKVQPGSAQAVLGARVARASGAQMMCIQALTLPNLRLCQRNAYTDTLFVPWFFGQAGEPASSLPGWSGLSLWQHPTVAVNGELPLMPSAGGGSASMQWMAVYSNATGGDPPVGLYVGAHSPDARLMLMMMESGTYSTAVRFVHLPDQLNENLTTSWVLPFEVVLAGFGETPFTVRVCLAILQRW
jgi:hypothetical protein